MRRLAILITYTLLLLTTAGASRFPENIRLHGTNYPKMGEHRTTYKLLFKLYDAALFTEPGATASDVLARECSFRMEFRYLRTIPKATILKSANHMLAKNLSNDALARIATSTDQLHSTYRSVEAGDISSLTYIPDQGTTFVFNGKALITIPGKEFAQYYLQIWLGERPISVELRNQLLGQ